MGRNKRNRRKKGRARRVLGWWLLVGICMLVLLASCYTRDPRRTMPRHVRNQTYRVHRLEVTAYCPCGVCCGWKRNWWGRPVHTYGANKGKPKQVGLTARGTRARPGTIAADTRIFPFGSVLYVPGYGYGVVEDRGGAIKGQKIDVYCRTHQQAVEWGRQQLDVKVWLPE